MASATRRRRRPPEWLAAGLALLAANLLFWKLRLIDPGTEPRGILTSDLYSEHFPMAEYGFRELASGRLPLWNPHQLLGLPFLAIPHTGLLYPGNLAYLIFDAALATEITLIGHLCLAGLGTWLLARTLGFGVPAAAAAAVTGMWAGPLAIMVNQPAVIAAICWLPVTVWLVEKTLRGSRAAPFALVLAVACQVLNGATERLLYNLYAAGFWSLVRLASLAWQGSGREALQRGGLLLACVLGGVLLSLPQLLPSLEVAAQSARAGERLSLDEALYSDMGHTTPLRFLRLGLSQRGQESVGWLPLLGIGLGLGYRRFRGLWGLSLALGGAALLLAFGGPLFRLYHLTPLGGLFRIPIKFLTLYAFAQSLLAALALARLADWGREGTGRRQLWRSPAWLAGLASLLTAFAWLHGEGFVNVHLLGALALLGVFGLFPQRRVRGAAIAALLLLQAASLFLAMAQTDVRPMRESDVFTAQRKLLSQLKQAAGLDRIYLSPEFHHRPELQMKQGMMTGSYFSVDYESLAMRRYARFFERASAPRAERERFAGIYPLHAGSRWRLMDLTSTRLYVFRRHGPEDLALEREGRDGGFLRYRRTADVGIWLRPDALPRAYYVAAARVLPDEETVLAGLDAPDFDPRREILLEAAELDDAPPPVTGGAGRVRIARYDPERVVLEVEADAPGFAVLTDLHYPGWRAWANGRPAPILRANYLMRAVAVGPGATRVTFAYRPQSLRTGAWLGGMAAAALACLGLRSWLHRARHG